jgi:hypothetical protein
MERRGHGTRKHVALGASLALGTGLNNDCAPSTSPGPSTARTSSPGPRGGFQRVRDEWRRQLGFELPLPCIGSKASSAGRVPAHPPPKNASTVHHLNALESPRRNPSHAMRSRGYRISREKSARDVPVPQARPTNFGGKHEWRRLKNPHNLPLLPCEVVTRPPP